MSSQTLRLYESNASPNSRRVRIFLAEKGIGVSLVSVDLGAKQQFSEPYTRINNFPLFGRNPSQHPVVRYFAQGPGAGDDVGAPDGVRGFAAVMETVRNAAAGLQGRTIAGAHDYEQIPALVERGRQRVKDFYVDLETRLSETPFVAGDRFSAADITAIVTVDFATKALSMPIPKGHAASERWYVSVEARPSMTA